MEILPAPVREHTSVSARDTAHAETGVHDTFRHGLRSLRAETSLDAQHPVQNRLERWDESQRSWKLQVQRDMFGVGMPLRTVMERRFVSVNPHMPARHIANVHLDILDGKDECLDPVDFLPSGVRGEHLDVHAAMERKMAL
ncbi:hypothetical protein MSPP1_001852 [Malassezia sp. CBS 17886]|nr:hypothetical protein MSPP1_001852 [Malassezia sp. CBS 17886]